MTISSFEFLQNYKEGGNSELSLSHTDLNNLNSLRILKESQEKGEGQSKIVPPFLKCDFVKKNIFYIQMVV